jgi:hypothetical protein
MDFLWCLIQGAPAFGRCSKDFVSFGNGKAPGVDAPIPLDKSVISFVRSA